MRVATLDRKLLRELWRLKGQMASIALVVAAGIMTVVTMRGGYDTLVDAQEAYYRSTRFPDVWVFLKRAPRGMEEELAAISGVAEVQTRVTLVARLDLPGLSTPGRGQFVSLPERGRPALSDIVVLRGRRPAPGARDEVVASDNFAAARGLEPGGSVRAIINGRARTLTVVGVAISPEHTYAVPPGALFPDDERYGVFWMSREVLGPAYDMDGAFNEVLVALTPGANPEAVLARLDRLLAPYGGLGAYTREEQPSHQILAGELEQNRVMGTAIPIVFLGVAAFLLNLVMGRMIATQRTEIAVLKAFGYTDREVGWHYLRFALASVAGGVVLGAGAGVWLGDAYIGLYGQYFDFPDLEFRPSPVLFLLAAGISLLAAAAGALGAVRRAVALPPAEAMRPEPPARFRPGPMERVGLGRVLSSSGRMILRNLERRPFQAFVSSLAVAFSVAILVVGMFMFDGVRFMMDLQFRVIQREDVAVAFQEPVGASVRHDLGRLEGVTRVEVFRTVPARLRAGHRTRDVGLQGLSADGRLRRIVSADGGIHPLPREGFVLSAYLAERLRVDTGDTVGVELLEGRREQGRVPVAGVVNDLLGVSATMSRSALDRLAGGSHVVSGAYLSVADENPSALNEALKGMPAVTSVTSPATMLMSFQEQLAESLFVTVGFLLGFAAVIAVGVIYNGARIALSERGRELASLRVMGFRRTEVAWLLLGEQAVVTIVAIPLGWILGYVLALAVAVSVETETFRIPLVVSARTYALSALVTLAAATASALIVRRRVDRLDLIAVLKTRE